MSDKTKRVSIDVSVDVNDANRALDNLAKKLANISTSKVDLKINVNKGQYTSQINQINSTVKKLSNTLNKNLSNIKIGFNTRQAEADINNFTANLTGTFDKIENISKQSSERMAKSFTNSFKGISNIANSIKSSFNKLNGSKPGEKFGNEFVKSAQSKMKTLGSSASDMGGLVKSMKAVGLAAGLSFAKSFMNATKNISKYINDSIETDYSVNLNAKGLKGMATNFKIDSSGMGKELKAVTKKASSSLLDFTKTVENIIKVIEQASKYFKANSEKIFKSLDKTATKLSKSKNPFISQFGKIIKDLTPGLKAFGRLVSSVAKVLQPVLRLLQPLARLISSLLGLLAAIGKRLEVLRPVVNTLTNIIGKLVDVISTAINKITRLVNRAERPSKGFNFSGFKGNLSKAFNVAGAATNIAKTLVKGIASKVSSFVKVGMNIGRAIANGVRRTIGLFKGIISLMTKAILGPINLVLNVGKAIGRAIHKGVTTVINVAKLGVNIVRTIVRGITGSISLIIKTGRLIANSIIKGVKAVVALTKLGITIVRTIVKGITGAISLVINAGKLIANAIIKGVKIVTTLTNLGITIARTIITGIVSLVRGFVNAGITIGRAIVKGVTSAVRFVGAFAKTFVNIGINISKAIARGIRSGLGFITNSIKAVTKGIMAPIKLLGRTISSTIGKAFSISKSVMGGIGNTIMEALDGDHTIELELVPSTGNIFTSLIDKRDVTNQLKRDLSVITQTMPNELGKVTNAFGARMIDAGVKVQRYANLMLQAYDFVRNNKGIITSTFQKLYNAMAPVAKRIISDLGIVLRDYGQKAMSALKAKIVETVAPVFEPFKSVLNAIAGEFSRIKDNLSGFTGQLKEIVTNTRSKFGEVASAFQSVATDVKAKLLDVISSFSTLSSDVKAKLSEIISSFNGVVGEIKSKFGDVADSFRTVADGIKSKIIEIINTFGNVINATRTAFREIITNLSSVTSNLKARLIDAAAMFGQMAGITKARLSDMVDRMRTKFDEAIGVIKKHLPSILEALTNLVGAIVANLKTAVEMVIALFNAFKPVIHEVINSLKGLVDSFISNSNKFKGAFDKVKDIFNGILKALKPIIDELVQIFKHIIAIVKNLAGPLKMIASVFGLLAKVSLSLVNSVLSVVEAITWVIKKVYEFGELITKGIKNVFTKMSNWVAEKTGTTSKKEYQKSKKEMEEDSGYKHKVYGGKFSYDDLKPEYRDNEEIRKLLDERNKSLDDAAKAMGKAKAAKYNWGDVAMSWALPPGAGLAYTTARSVEEKYKEGKARTAQLDVVEADLKLAEYLKDSKKDLIVENKKVQDEIKSESKSNSEIKGINKALEEAKKSLEEFDKVKDESFDFESINKDLDKFLTSFKDGTEAAAKLFSNTGDNVNNKFTNASKNQFTNTSNKKDDFSSLGFTTNQTDSSKPLGKEIDDFSRKAKETFIDLKKSLSEVFNTEPVKKAKQTIQETLNGEEVEKFKQTITSGFDSIKGDADNLKDSISELFNIDSVKEFKDTVTGAFDGETTNKIKETVTDAFDGQTTNTIKEAFISAFDGETTNKIKEAISGVFDNSFVNNIKEKVSKAAEAAKKTATTKATDEEVKQAKSNLKNTAKTIKQKVELTAETRLLQQKLDSTFQSMRHPVNALKEYITAKLGKVHINLTVKGEQQAKKAVNDVARALEKFKSAKGADKLTAGIDVAIQSIKYKLITLKNTMKENFVSNLINKMAPKAKKASKELAENVPGGSKTIGFFKSSLGKLSLLLGGFGIGAYIKQATDLAIKYEASAMQIQHSLGSASQKIMDFAQNSAAALGISQTDAMTYGNKFSLMVRQFEKDTDKIANTTNALMQAAAITASATGTELSTVMDSFQSALTGSSEAVDQYGLNMKIANLEARLGIDNWNELTVAQQQFYITQELINQTTANFGNKSLKNTNSMLAQFKAQLSNTSLALGKTFKALLTVVLPYLTAFLKVLEKVFNYIATMITSLLSLFGITVDFTSNAASGIEAVGGDIDTTGLDGVSEGMDNAADSADNAAESVEKMKGSLAGFDELNTLSFTEDSSGDSGAGDLPVGGIDTSDLDSGLAELGESDGVFDVLQNKLEGFKEWFDKLIERAKELAKLFKEGFDLSFDASKLKDIWESLKSIGESLKYIFFNDEVAAALENLANKFAFAMGQIVGAIANIGASIIQMLVGGIAQALDENKDWIKEKLITCIDVTAEIWELLGNFAQALSEIFGVLGEEEGKGIIANIVSGLLYAFGTHAEIMLKLGRDILDLITGPIVDNVDAIKENFKSFLGTLEKITGTIKDSIKAVCDTISQTYDEKIAPTLQRLRDGFSDTMAKFQEVYAKYIQPVLDFMAEKFDMVMDKYITPALQNLVSLFGTLIEVLGIVYETALKPLIDFIIQVIVPVAMPILAAAWNTIVTVVGVVIGVIGDLLGVLDGFLTFLVGVFQGDWEKAWGGLQKCSESFFKIFKDIWDGICSLFDNGKLYLESFKNFFKGMVDYVKGRMEYFKEKIGDNAEKAWENIKKPFELMGQWFKDTFTKALDGIKNAWSGIKTWASEKYNDFTSAFSNFGTWCKDTWSKAYTLATGAWSNLKTWASGLPTTISNGLSNLSSTMSSKFSSAWTACKNAFSGVATWASGLASTIGDKFRNLGSTVGEAIGGAVKGAINGVISTIERTINGAIGLINGAIKLINKIPGVNVSTISSVSLPRLANGGLVTTSTLANIGEAGPEAVIPLNRSNLWAPQLASELAKQLSVSGIGQSNNSSRPLEVKLVVDGRELGRASINNINKLQRESNEILLDI